MLEPTPTRRQHGAVERDYWLAHCEGFRVDGSGGRIGVVEEIRPGGLLAVRAGLLGRRLLIFDPADAIEIVPRAKRVHLDTSAVPRSSEPAATAA